MDSTSAAWIMDSGDSALKDLPDQINIGRDMRRNIQVSPRASKQNLGVKPAEQGTN